jgi:hypothetical protein
MILLLLYVMQAVMLPLCHCVDLRLPQLLEPPRELQRIDVPVPESAGYTLFSPIELTNKDYLCRVFDMLLRECKAPSSA